MIYWIIVAICWLVGIFVAYFKFIKNWDNSTFEKIWFSVLWPCLIPLYIIYWIHNNW